MRLTRVAFYTLVSVVVSSAASRAWAQPTDGEDALFDVEEERRDEQEGASDRERVPRRDRDEALDRMNRAQLERSGFVFSDVSASRKRSTALVMATLPGVLLHGAGHLYLNETETAIALMSMEFAGLGLMALGAGLPFLTQGQVSSAGLSRQAFYGGAGLFISSYILDVVGVTRTEDQIAFRSPENRQGGAFSLAYRFFATPRYPINHGALGKFRADLGKIYTQAETLQGISLFTSHYDAMVGWRIFSMPNTEHAVFVEAEGGYQRFRGEGRYDRWDGGGLIGGTLDLGILSPSLRFVYIGLKLGYNHQWYAYPESRTPEDDVLQDEVSSVTIASNVGSMPFELYGGMNFTSKLSIRLAYTRRDGELLHDINRLAAVPSVKVVYSRADNFDVILDAAYGGGLMLGGDLRFWLW